MTAIRVCVCDCTQGNRTSRFPIQVSQLNGKTESLFSEIAKQIGSSENEFEIFYCGQKLERDMGLETFNLTPQSTLFVFRKKQQAEAAKGTSGKTSAGEMMPLINRAVQHPNYRKTVDHILTNQDSLQKLLAAVPGLDNDPIAMSMLQDPELLQILVHRQNFFSVMKKHPLFEKAAAYVAGIVNEEHARDPARAVRSNVYSMDQMSDDEDEGNQRGATGRPPQQQITASQLAAALAAATASAAAHPSTSASSSSQGAAGGSSGSGSNTSVISPDFFQQAMMTAQSSALETQLQQLRDMGISDENVARRALTATGGDLQAALELIFGDGVQ